MIQTHPDHPHVTRTNLGSVLQEGDPKPKVGSSTSTSTAPKTDAGGLGLGVYAIILIGGAAAFFAYQYMQSSQGKS